MEPGHYTQNKQQETPCRQQPPLPRMAPPGLDRMYFSRGRGWINWSDKTVAPPRHRFDKPRGIGRIAQCIPQAPDSRVQAMVEIDKGVGRPKLASQFLPANHLAGPLQ